MYRQILRTARNRQDVLNGRREWFEFKNATGDRAEISIYSEIGFFGITADDFVSELRGVTASAIDLHINSPGGDVFDGISIYNALSQHSAAVNVTVDGIAASIASVIAMAGDTVTMTRGSMVMIHEPFALVIGDSRDMRKTAEALDKMGDSIAEIYAARAGKKPEDWRAVMAEETWYTAQEAVDAGLADVVATAAAVKNTFDLSIFRNGPREIATAVAPAGADNAWRQEARLKMVAAMEEMANAKAC